MKLSCETVCVKVKKKSKSPAFKDLNIGDIIEFSTDMKPVGRAKGTYATYIRCYNPKTKKESRLSFNQIKRTLECFVLEEIDELHVVYCDMGYPLKENGFPPDRCNCDMDHILCKNCKHYIKE